MNICFQDNKSKKLLLSIFFTWKRKTGDIMNDSEVSPPSTLLPSVIKTLKLLLHQLVPPAVPPVVLQVLPLSLHLPPLLLPLHPPVVHPLPLYVGCLQEVSFIYIKERSAGGWLVITGHHLEVPAVSPPPHSRPAQAGRGSSAGPASAGGPRPGRRGGSLAAQILRPECQHFSGEISVDGFDQEKKDGKGPQ